VQSNLEKSDSLGFRKAGVLFPVEVLSGAEIFEALSALRRIEAAPAAIRRSLLTHKSHLVSKTLNTLVRNPSILRAVERIIGPNILVWGSDFFIKEPETANFVSWHQDAAYWGLTPDDVVTAWIALTPSTQENGCLKVIPGTHTEPLMPHTNTFARENMLSRGQTIEGRLLTAQAINVVLAPGQMSVHHVKIAHASGPNRSLDRRVGFAIRYIAAHVRQQRDVVDTATLVQGLHVPGSFALEPSPAGELLPEDIAFHQATWQAEQQIIAASDRG
jgi:ectoine hydroxylase-related dioxygenase (phytanoyl-CoA dioxygenase family)